MKKISAWLKITEYLFYWFRHNDLKDLAHFFWVTKGLCSMLAKQMSM